MQNKTLSQKMRERHRDRDIGRQQLQQYKGKSALGAEENLGKLKQNENLHLILSKLKRYCIQETKTENKPCSVAHTCDLSYSRGYSRRSQTSGPGNLAMPQLKTKK